MHSIDPHAFTTESKFLSTFFLCLSSNNLTISYKVITNFTRNAFFLDLSYSCLLNNSVNNALNSLADAFKGETILADPTLLYIK